MIVRSASMRGQLNAFQKVMLHWSELHPYSAAHTYKIAGPLQLDLLREAIRETYWFNGIGAVELDGDAGTYRHEVDDEPEVRVLEGGEDSEAVLGGHLSRELNHRFPRPRCNPFRFSVIDAGPSAHYISTTYDHWVADSVAARLVMRHVLGRYLGLNIPENQQPLELCSATYREAFAHRFGYGRAVQSGLRSLKQWWDNRAATQVGYSSSMQMAVNYELRAAAPGTVLRLHRFASSIGAKVHDVLLAALGRAVAEFLPRRSKRGGTGELSLGTIVDTRKDACMDLSESLGAFLAYYLVRFRPNEARSLSESARQVAAMTRPIKAGHGYLDSLVNMKIINALWPWLSDAVRPHFMRKALPMVAGISNVRLLDPWMQNQGAGRILGYSRAASCGPMLPLVLTPTTFNDEMNVGITYRVTGFTRTKIEGIMERFLEQIENPSQDRLRRHPIRTHRPLAVPELVAGGRSL